MNSPKATKKINTITKSWDKNAFKDLEHVCPKQDHEFFLIVALSESFTWNKIIFPICQLSDALNCSMINLEKRLNHFHGFKFVDTDKIFHNTKNLQHQRFHCPVKKICLAPCAVNCCFVYEGVIRAVPNFFICFSKFLNSGTAMVIQVFHPLIQ